MVIEYWLNEIPVSIIIHGRNELRACAFARGERHGRRQRERTVGCMARERRDCEAVLIVCGPVCPARRECPLSEGDTRDRALCHRLFVLRMSEPVHVMIIGKAKSSRGHERTLRAARATGRDGGPPRMVMETRWTDAVRLYGIAD